MSARRRLFWRSRIWNNFIRAFNASAEEIRHYCANKWKVTERVSTFINSFIHSFKTTDTYFVLNGHLSVLSQAAHVIPSIPSPIMSEILTWLTFACQWLSITATLWTDSAQLSYQLLKWLRHHLRRKKFQFETAFQRTETTKWTRLLKKDWNTPERKPSVPARSAAIMESDQC